jgi:hypothetical protein
MLAGKMTATGSKSIDTQGISLASGFAGPVAMLEGEGTSVADLQHQTVTAGCDCIVVCGGMYNRSRKKTQGKSFRQNSAISG